MPRPRQYETDAERVAAWRRKKKAETLQIEEAALPAPSALPNIASAKRWTALMTKAQENLQAALEDMQEYYDERTEEWQESDRGQEFAARLEALESVIQDLEAI